MIRFSMDTSLRDLPGPWVSSTGWWPRANGEVERFMRTLKKAVQTAQMESGSGKQKLHRFLRHYHASPHSTTRLSPFELLNSQKLRTKLPSGSAIHSKAISGTGQEWNCDKSSQ